MLQELLKLLEDGQTRSLGSLAQDLGTTREMVEAMLESLERLGFVRHVTGCEQSCQRCSIKRACATKSAARIWAVAEREESG
jgi:DNA-binding MarR family transcriptional regulator